MWIEEDNLLRPSVFFLLTKSSILRTFFFCEETMKVLPSIEFMVFMMNVKGDITYRFGNNFLCVLILCQSQL